jgi:hypothetical protein
VTARAVRSLRAGGGGTRTDPVSRARARRKCSTARGSLSLAKPRLLQVLTTGELEPSPDFAIVTP